MDIIRDGIILAVYLFIISLLYIFTSNPFTVIISNLMTLDAASHTVTQLTMQTVSTVYLMMFVMLGGIPIVWFIMRVFQREPDWGYY
jgi:spore germination protein GerM